MCSCLFVVDNVVLLLMIDGLCMCVYVRNLL